MDAQMKISRGITRLAFNKKTCFYGTILLSIGTREEQSVPTMATDGTVVMWNRSFVDRITPDEVIAVLLHEAMHVAFKHMLRLFNRNMRKWNVATDYMINLLVMEMGFTLPEGALLDPLFDGMNAEKIYDMIEDEHGAPQWGEFMEPEAATDAEMKQIEANVNQKIMAAAAVARARGALPAEVSDIIDKINRAEVDLYDYLKRKIGGDQPEDITFARVNRKMFWEAGMIAPNTKRDGIGNVILGVDSSASVSEAELGKFLSIMNSLADDLQPESVTVITCDTEVRNVTRYERGEPIQSIKVGGRGGTNVSPVFDLIKEHDMPVDHMIYLSDMEVWDYPRDAPDYPVTWVSCWLDGKPAPFGDTTYIN